MKWIFGSIPQNQNFYDYLFMKRLSKTFFPIRMWVPLILHATPHRQLRRRHDNNSNCTAKDPVSHITCRCRRRPGNTNASHPIYNGPNQLAQPHATDLGHSVGRSALHHPLHSYSLVASSSSSGLSVSCQSEQCSCTGGDALALQRRRRMHFWSGLLLLLSEDMGVSSEPRGVGAMQASDEHVFISCVRPKIVCFAFLLLSLAKGGGGGGGEGRLGLFLILDSTVVAAGRPRSPKHIMDNHCIVVPIRGLLIS